MTTQKHYCYGSTHNNINFDNKVTHIINDHFADIAVFATFIPQVVTDLVDQYRVALEDKRNDKADILHMMREKCNFDWIKSGLDLCILAFYILLVYLFIIFSLVCLYGTLIMKIKF